jgi:hypothetical protein
MYFISLRERPATEVKSRVYGWTGISCAQREEFPRVTTCNWRCQTPAVVLRRKEGQERRSSIRSSPRKLRAGALVRGAAIKILPAEFAKNPARRQRFVQDAKSASALNHPNSPPMAGTSSQLPTKKLSPPSAQSISRVRFGYEHRAG